MRPRRRTLCIALGFAGAGVSTAWGSPNRGKEQTVDTGNGAKRAAWLVCVVLTCGLCYSIGFQAGWSDATVRSDRRMDQMTATLQEMVDLPSLEEHRADTARTAGETPVAQW